MVKDHKTNEQLESLSESYTHIFTYISSKLQETDLLNGINSIDIVSIKTRIEYFINFKLNFLESQLSLLTHDLEENDKFGKKVVL